MEDWQLELCQDPKLIKLLDKDYDKESFLLSLLNQSTQNELSELFSKLTNVKQNIHTSVNATINDNYQILAKDYENLSELTFDIDECKQRMNHVNNKLKFMEKDFLNSFEILQQKAPILKNTKDALSLSKYSLKFVQNIKNLRSIVNNKNEILDLNKSCLIIREIIKLINEKNLDGLPFYEEQKDFLNSIKENATIANGKKFNESLTNKNVIECVHALQNFYNLCILADRIQECVNQILTNITNLWKKCVSGEYEKTPSGLVNLEKQIKHTLAEQLTLNGQVWILKNCLRNRDIISLESFATYLKNRNINNLFEVVWDRQLRIFNATWKRVLENPKFEGSKIIMTKCYPKILFLFEDFLRQLVEFIIKYPDPADEIDFKILKDKLLETLQPFHEPYFIEVSKEMISKLKQINTSIFQADSSYYKNYSGLIHTELAKLTQFLNFEMKENIRHAKIYARFIDILADNIKTTLTDMFQIYEKTDAKNLSLNKIFCLFTACFELQRLLIEKINHKFNEDIDIAKIDDVSKFALSHESNMLIVVFHNLNDSMANHLNQLLEFYKKNMNNKNLINNDVLETIQTFYLNYSPNVNKTLENNIPFYDKWNNLMSLMIYLYASIIFLFDHTNEKIKDIINRDCEVIGNLIEKFNKKDTYHRMLIINLQKLTTLLEVQDILMYIDNNHDFIKNIPRTLLIICFIKRIERDYRQNITLASIKKKDKEKNIFDILSNFFSEDITHNIGELHIKFEDNNSIENSTSQFIEALNEIQPQKLEANKNYQVLKKLIKS